MCVVVINTNLSFFEITVIVRMSRQNVMVVAFLCHGQMSLIHYSVFADLPDFIISSISSLVVIRHIVLLRKILLQFYDKTKLRGSSVRFQINFYFHFPSQKNRN